MENNFLNAKLKQDRHLKQKKDTSLKIFVVVFLLGYIFFFTSNFSLPKVYRYDTVTYIGETIDMDDYALTLDTFDYSKDDNSFEIIFELDNFSIDENFEKSFVCRNGDIIYKTKIYKTFDNYIVLRVSGIPKKWSEVSILANIGSQSCTIKMNDKKATKAGELKDRTKSEYEKHIAETLILGLKEQKKEIKKEKEKLEKQVETANDRIDELEESKENQTQTEVEKTDENIQKLQNEQDNIKTDIEECESKIQELNAKIKKEQKMLD